MGEMEPKADESAGAAGTGKTPAIDPLKQLEYAKDAVTQVVSLSAAILAVSLTFSKDWAAGASSGELFLLRSAWVGFLVAIVTGVWALLALSGIALQGRGTLRSWSLRLPWLLEMVGFLAGLCLLTLFGFAVL